MESPMKTKIVLDVDADFNGSNLDELASLLIQEINELTIEKYNYDINDPFTDYLEGLIAAKQTICSRIGVPLELTYPEGDC